MARGAVAFFGDFLGLQETPEILSMIKQNGDTKVIFSELVKKVNKRYKVRTNKGNLSSSLFCLLSSLRFCPAVILHQLILFFYLTLLIHEIS